MTRIWTPILSATDSLTPKAWDAVNAIAATIEKGRYRRSKRQAQHPDRSYQDTLLFGYLGVARDEQRWVDLAVDRLNTVIEHADQFKSYLGLYGGLCGLAWTTEHLAQLLGTTDTLDDEDTSVEEDEGTDILEEVDIALVSRLRSEPWNATYDLIGGLVGIGIYFIERLPSDRAAEGIKLVLYQLEKLAQRTDAGLTWHSGPQLLPEWQREKCPGGYYNMGVAHGIPGVLFLLSEMASVGIERERSLQMLDGAMNWFLAHRLPSGFRSRFSPWIPTPGEMTDSSRLAWCYGDLGILGTLTQIAKRTQRQEWLQFSQDLLEHCLAAREPMAGLVDAPLCHGAMGSAHIYNRLYQLNGDERCLHAALYFIEQSLDMRQPGSGIGGFFAVTRPDPKGPKVLDPSPDFLDGASGLALALLAALTPLEPHWDRLLLLSGREASLIGPNLN